jgi:hypothetical protein
MESALEEIQSGELKPYRSPPSQLVRAIRPRAAEQKTVANLLRYFIIVFFIYKL